MPSRLRKKSKLGQMIHRGSEKTLDNRLNHNTHQVVLASMVLDGVRWVYNLGLMKSNAKQGAER